MKPDQMEAKMTNNQKKNMKIPVIGILIVGAVIASGYFLWGKKVATGVEKTRQDKVKAELALTIIEPETTDIVAVFKKFGNVPDTEIIAYRDGIKKLMDIAPFMQTLYMKQIGTSPDDRIKTATDNDRDLFDRYGHPWCLSDTSPECVAIPAMPKRTSGVIADGVSCDKVIGSPFEAVVKDEKGKLKTVSYSELYSEESKKSAALLREAAEIFKKIPREAAFVTYLTDLANAFESKDAYPLAGSDTSWTNFLASDSLMFARIGADEVGGDGVGDDCESKARFHFNIGIRNKSAQEIVERLRPMIGEFEKRFANLIAMPANYTARDIQVQLPTFIDVAFANGDDIGGPAGTNIGQTLPNWCGKDGKGECMHGTMIYVNKTLKAYNEKIMKDYIMPIFNDKLMAYFNPMLGLDSVVYHEMFHNLGPRSGSKYEKNLVTKAGVSWKGPLEELKAQTGSLFMANEYFKEAIAKHNAKEMDDATFEKEQKHYREHILYDMAWAMRMILRASRSGPEYNPKSIYSKLAAVQVGFFADQGAMIWDKNAKRWDIDFDKMPNVINELTKKMGQLYATANVDEVEKLFNYYMKGEGEKQLHRDRLVEIGAKMPSVLFDYKVKGI